MEEFSIYTYLNIILICSLIGFVTENIWLIFRYGYFDNRNMNLPFLLGYGVSFVLLYKLIGLPEEMPDIKYFMSVMFIVSAGEIILGTLVEKVCHIHYWDYSSLPFHLTRYTSLFTSIGFAVAVTLFMRECFPRIAFYLSENETVMMKFVGIIGNIVLFLDFLYSFKKMYEQKSLYKKWRINVGGLRSVKTGSVFYGKIQ